MQAQSNCRDIVLVGGGHAHAVVLRMWAEDPLPGVRLTLVSPKVDTAYSGMLPGLIAGHYRPDEIHIDLVRLFRAAGARFVQSRAHRIDPCEGRIFLQGHPDLEYGLLSLDVGATPARDLPGAELAIPVKPIDQFHHHWQQLQKRLRESSTSLALGVIGGGAGGCEVAMAMAYALKTQHRSHRVQIHLIHSGDSVPEGYPARARDLVARELNRLGVHLHRNWPVGEISESGVRSTEGQRLALDHVLLCTSAAAPPWLADCGLALDKRGFIRVDEKLRAPGYPNIFAAGDVASFSDNPLPKAGVYAVRQGPVLFHNLRAALSGKRLRDFRPQKHFLSLLSCGDKRAIAVRNGFALAGTSLWHLKHHIDRKFMRRFSQLPLPS
ncbi:FAD-dependent oxidoreductase [Microbulbifer thermotolerans]|uniref:FAD-dependent oxidoreductase n=1 Tax=Microbulbifer thermotolerans TaxID=252514 RepID=UPI0022499D38|nr:FAD-dependent oxidoreductase [Microbulbifer thermotolerans]MCX2832258.1 FAD-dependent oxidoreductase [Microbulbifer thermotolerans]